MPNWKILQLRKMVLSHNTLRDAIPTQKKSQPGILHTFSLRMLASMLNIYLLPNLASIEPPPEVVLLGIGDPPAFHPGCVKYTLARYAGLIMAPISDVAAPPGQTTQAQ